MLGPLGFPLEVFLVGNLDQRCIDAITRKVVRVPARLDRSNLDRSNLQRARHTVPNQERIVSNGSNLARWEPTDFSLMDMRTPLDHPPL